jgi:hypothetical protein
VHQGKRSSDSIKTGAAWRNHQKSLKEIYWKDQGNGGREQNPQGNKLKNQKDLSLKLVGPSSKSRRSQERTANPQRRIESPLKREEASPLGHQLVSRGISHQRWNGQSTPKDHGPSFAHSKGKTHGIDWNKDREEIKASLLSHSRLNLRSLSLKTGDIWSGCSF